MYNPMVGGVPSAVYTNNNIGVGGPTPTQVMDSGSVVAVDGTPVRLVMLMFASALGIYAMRLSGIKFNVGVSA